MGFFILRAKDEDRLHRTIMAALNEYGAIRVEAMEGDHIDAGGRLQI